MTTTVRLPTQEPGSDNDRPFLGRRMTWAEFYRMFPDRRPANENKPSPHLKKVQKLGARVPGRGQHARIHI